MPKTLPDRIGKCYVCLAVNVMLHHGECRECQDALATHRQMTNGEKPARKRKPVYRVAAMKR